MNRFKLIAVCITALAAMSLSACAETQLIMHASKRINRNINDAELEATATQNAALSIDEIKEMQSLLVEHGLDTGGIDGIIGPKTRMAIRRYQENNGLDVGESPSRELLDSLRNG